MQNNLRLASLAIAAVVAACGGSNGSDDKDSTAGPCVVMYEEPILLITSARDGASSASIPEITLTEIKVNGAMLDLRALGATTPSARVVGNSIQCTLPCGFATTEGAYSAILTASGYQSSVLSVAAQYQSLVGGCPATYGGGRRVAVSLQPL